MLLLNKELQGTACESGPCRKCGSVNGASYLRTRQGWRTPKTKSGGAGTMRCLFPGKHRPFQRPGNKTASPVHDGK